jgi:hypothetical protein
MNDGLFPHSSGPSPSLAAITSSCPPRLQRISEKLAEGDGDGTLSVGTGSTVYSLTNSTINRIGRDNYNITNVINTSDNHKPDHVISVSRVVDGLLALTNS